MDNGERLSQQIVEFARINCWPTIAQLSWADIDEDLCSQIYNFDFRYCSTGYLGYLARWAYKKVDRY